MLENYNIKEIIYEGRANIVYKAVRVDDQCPVILKTYKSDYPTQEELDQLRHEYNISRQLDIEGVIKPYSIEKYENTLVLVLEWFDGVTLKNIITNNSCIHPFKEGVCNTPLQEFFDYSIRIINAIVDIHSNRVIHKDINSHNILVNPDTSVVKITDFCLSCYFDEKSQDNKRLLKGSLAYISPEQTGRLDRIIDHRSDLYSLGVVLYEMLTSRLPFESIDPLEIVHCHLTAEPVPPHKIVSTIPIILSKIIVKLLSKHPINRYQSAYGLLKDIERCRAALTGKIKTFKLGTNDITNIDAPIKLYGREKEINQLSSIFNRVMEGRFESVFITGQAGQGKSALIEEFVKRSGVKIISGKNDQFLRNIPYSSITAAFRMFIRDILTKSDEDIERWRTLILNAAGDYGRILTDMIPEMKLIIGDTPDVPHLPSDKAQNRFHYIFQRFIEGIIDKDHPLTIFLDDIHWADPSSLHLLEHLLSNARYPYLLIICAYRDNEVKDGQLINLDGINYINILPLEQNYVETLIADMMKHSDTKLSGVIYKKCGGNPFFIVQFIKSLQEERLIHFENGRCIYDITKIQSKEDTDNVVDLMIKRIEQLPPSTQYLLNYAACLGKGFDINTLALIVRIDIGIVKQQIAELLSKGFLIHRDNQYSFPHDRIEQASYLTITEIRKRKIHHEIGTHLLRQVLSSELIQLKYSL
jgi:serine/threonine protein kinase